MSVCRDALTSSRNAKPEPRKDISVGDDIELGLIVGAARSGTTLTRLLLDAHPEVGCPAEAGLPALMSHLAQVWLTVHADELASKRDDPGTAGDDQHALARWEEPEKARDNQPNAEPLRKLPPAAREWIIDAVQVPMRSYCARSGKRIYFDKSLDSVHHLPVVHQLLPDAKVILVFRHVMDTIASGIEASPWGFQAYGYGQYIQMSPGNSVAALANYWLDHVERALRWEEQHAEQCHRITYEQLVLNPEETLAGIMGFLGVREDLSVLATAFDREPSRGPGDFKIEYTTEVHAASIGHGKRVPVTLVPPRLLEAVRRRCRPGARRR